MITLAIAASLLQSTPAVEAQTVTVPYEELQALCVDRQGLAALYAASLAREHAGRTPEEQAAPRQPFQDRRHAICASILERLDAGKPPVGATPGPPGGATPQQ